MNTPFEILAVGLNPARQRTLEFDAFSPGSVNRAVRVSVGAGGKASHCARAIRTLAPGTVTVGQFLGGDAGREVAACLSRDGIDQINGWTACETRTCTTVLCRRTGAMTELIEPPGEVDPTVCGELHETLMHAVGGCAGLALCGTYPPGVPASFYASLAAAAHDAVVLVDAYRGIEETLVTGRVDVLKINVAEICSLTGCCELQTAAAACFKRYRLRWLAVTDGPHEAFLFDGRARWRYELPKLDRVVNPIGAGDTASGALLVSLLQGLPTAAAFGRALAAASASCRHLEGARFDPGEADELFARMRIDAG